MDWGTYGTLRQAAEVLGGNEASGEESDEGGLHFVCVGRTRVLGILESEC